MAALKDAFLWQKCKNESGDWARKEKRKLIGDNVIGVVADMQVESRRRYAYLHLSKPSLDRDMQVIDSKLQNINPCLDRTLLG